MHIHMIDNVQNNITIIIMVIRIVMYTFIATLAC